MRSIPHRCRAASAALRASLAAFGLIALLSGCIVAQTPPSAAQACDPALIGDWGLVEGDGYDRARTDDDALFGADGERRFRVDAHCRAYLPAQYDPRQVDLGVYKADAHRYLGLKIEDAAMLTSGPKHVRAQDNAALLARYPRTVVLMRYRIDGRSLSLDLGDSNALKRWIEQRNQRGGASQTQPDFLAGSASAVRKQLRAHPELFPGEQGTAAYRFERLPANAP